MKLGMFSMAVLFGATVLFGQDARAQDPQDPQDPPVAQAQIPRETSQTVKVRSQSLTRDIQTTTVVGQVTGFKAGKTITVTTPGHNKKTFDISKNNTTIHGTSNVRSGDIVSLTETIEGKTHTIYIACPYARGVRTDTAVETEIMQAETQASGQVPNHIQRDVTRSTPLGVTETKTTTAVGKVTEYKKGNELKVTAPHNKVTTFYLKGATVSGQRNLGVGELVRVTETKEGKARQIRLECLGRGQS